MCLTLRTAQSPMSSLKAEAPKNNASMDVTPDVTQVGDWHRNRLRRARIVPRSVTANWRCGRTSAVEMPTAVRAGCMSAAASLLALMFAATSRSPAGAAAKPLVQDGASSSAEVLVEGRGVVNIPNIVVTPRGVPRAYVPVEGHIAATSLDAGGVDAPMSSLKAEAPGWGCSSSNLGLRCAVITSPVPIVPGPRPPLPF